MRKSVKIFFAIIFFLYTGHTSLAQTSSLLKDSLNVNMKKTESTANEKEQNIIEPINNQAGKAGNNNGSIKQVKSARPDMSKSRGARPPDIVRPSGSRIPKGVGKPAGAVRPGRR